MSDQTIKLETLKSGGRGPAQKNGQQPEGAARSDFTMLKVAERPATRKPARPKVVPLVQQKFHTVSDVRRAQLWLDDQVAAAGSNVTTVVADMTPDLATVLLERNPANRKLKVSKVTDYAKDMAAGSWKFNGEPFIIARDGLLNDGQHRCAAVVESRVPIRSLMVFGVDRDTRDTLDQGANRTAGDYLAIHGHHFTNHLAAVAKAVWQWRTFGGLSTAGSQRPTRGEILQTALENPGLVKSFEFVNRPNAAAMGSTSALGFAHFAIGRVANKTDTDFFFECLIDGANLKSGDPVLTVRNRLIMDRKSLTLPEKAELLFRAWNAHRREQTRVLFRISGGELPMLEA